MTIVWTDTYHGDEYTKEQLVEAASEAVEEVLESFACFKEEDEGQEPTWENVLDYARHEYRCGCDSKDPWQGLYEVDEALAVALLEEAWSVS